MKFDLYEDYEEKHSNWVIGLLLLICILLISNLLLVDILDNGQLQWLYLIIGLVYVIYFVSRFFHFYSKTSHSKGQKKILEIQELGIFWDKILIRWHDLHDFQADDEEVEMKRDWLRFELGNSLSDGFNKIQIISKDGIKYLGHYLLTSKLQKDALREQLKTYAIKHQLPYELAKKIVKPANYQEHQDLKNLLT